METKQAQCPADHPSDSHFDTRRRSKGGNPGINELFPLLHIARVNTYMALLACNDSISFKIQTFHEYNYRKNVSIRKH